jgi:hypothetical protein
VNSILNLLLLYDARKISNGLTTGSLWNNGQLHS